jgi:hypothetical protein
MAIRTRTAMLAAVLLTVCAGTGDLLVLFSEKFFADISQVSFRGPSPEPVSDVVSEISDAESHPSAVNSADATASRDEPEKFDEMRDGLATRNNPQEEDPSPWLLEIERPMDWQIPIATPSETLLMTQSEYDEYARELGNLPVISKTYVFGHTIPLPETDEHGYVIVLTPQLISEALDGQIASPAPRPLRSPDQSYFRTAKSQRPPDKIPVATVNGVELMSHDEYVTYTQHFGNLPTLTKSYIFGHTIPMPRTDANGHIPVSIKEQQAPVVAADVAGASK